jgi:hypothetical protein
MPLDEDILHDLMHRATEDLHARPTVAAGIAADRRRRHLRTRALGFTVTGVAAATAVGVAAVTAGTASKPAAHNSARQGPTRPTITLTASVRTLNRLSRTAAAGQPGSGRYVELSELNNPDKRTTIIDSRTGDIWTFQSGKGVPSTFPVSRHGSPTLAQFAAYPTGLSGLRSLLVRQAEHDQAIAWRFQVKAAKIKDPKNWRQVLETIKKDTPRETRDDLVFSQAAYLLWNPLVPPSLRSALFKVLAATPGVKANDHAHDSIGRSAVEISRYDQAASYTEAIFESPDASRVYETASIHTAAKPANGLPGEAGYNLNDTYLTVTWHNTLPAKDPYRA